jgi:limonene-1,2-epoxide hydrolase
MNRDESRALALLADTGRNGTTNAILAAHGVTANMVISLIRGGLAIAMTEQVRAGTRMIEIVRVRITAAGQRVIEGQVLE